MKWILSIVAVIVLAFVLIAGITYRAIRGHFISKKAAKEKVEEVVRQKYDNAWKVVDIDRFFNEGNMNPNMFRVEFQDRKVQGIHFMVYWDAKKEAVGTPGFEDLDFTKAYLYAKKQYEMEVDLREQMGEEFQEVSFSGNEVTLKVDFEPDIRYMKTQAVRLCDYMKKYPEEWDGSARIVYCSPEKSDGLYMVYAVPFYEQDTSIYVEYDPYSILLRRYDFQKERPRAIAEMNRNIAGFEALIKEKTKGKGELETLYPIRTWVNQKDLNDISALYYVRKVNEKGDYSSRDIGYIVVRYNLFTKDMELKDMKFFDRLEYDGLFQKIESALPDDFHVGVVL